jgi:hypothetical protein
MPTEIETTVQREAIGEVHVERVPEGMRLFVKCAPWAKLVETRPQEGTVNICNDLSEKMLYQKPEGISGVFRYSYGILYDGKVNLAPLLAHGLADGQEFKFAGVYTSDTLKKIATEFKNFLVTSYNDYSRPVKIEYRLTAE